MTEHFYVENQEIMMKENKLFHLEKELDTRLVVPKEVYVILYNREKTAEEKRTMANTYRDDFVVYDDGDTRLTKEEYAVYEELKAELEDVIKRLEYEQEQRAVLSSFDKLNSLESDLGGKIKTLESLLPELDQKIVSEKEKLIAEPSTMEQITKNSKAKALIANYEEERASLASNLERLKKQLTEQLKELSSDLYSYVLQQQAKNSQEEALRVKQLEKELEEAQQALQDKRDSIKSYITFRASEVEALCGEEAFYSLYRV